MRLRLPLAFLAFSCLVTLCAQSPSLRSDDKSDKYLGNLNTNRYDPNSVSNPYGTYGSRYSPDSINNPYGQYGSPYSPLSATNPYATDAPKIVTPDGKYLGRLSVNPYAPDSTSNPYGKFGSPYSGESINNPYGTYGSRYSPESVNNPYATGPAPVAPRPRPPAIDSLVGAKAFPLLTPRLPSALATPFPSEPEP